jgi:hypothetical protein
VLEDMFVVLESQISNHSFPLHDDNTHRGVELVRAVAASQPQLFLCGPCLVRIFWEEHSTHLGMMLRVLSTV